MFKNNNIYKVFSWLLLLIVIATFIDKQIHFVGKFRRHIYPDTLLYLYANSKKGKKERSAKKDQFSIQKSLEVTYPVTEEKSFVVLIPSYNNEDFCTRNLESVFSQNYSNYRVIYIDDQSSDNTLNLVKQCITKHQMESRVTLISNKKRSLKMENVYRAIHEQCEDHEIVMMLDGDDWLLHEEVLNQFNQGYANPNVWVAYGKAIEHPEYKIIRGHLMSNDFFMGKHARGRSVFFMCMPRTFYAGIYKKIRLEDLMYEGEFFKVNADLAAIFPLAELAAGHVLHIKQLMYSINRSNPINDSKIRLQSQLEIDDYIRNLPVYATLKKDDVDFIDYGAIEGISKGIASQSKKEKSHIEKTDLLMIADKSPMHVSAALDGIKKFGEGIDKITVVMKLYESDTATVAEREKIYAKLKETYPSVEFRIYKNLKKLDLSGYLTRNQSASHLIIADDSIMMTKPVNFSSSIKKMRKTSSNHMFFALNRHDTSWLNYINHQIKLTDNISAWQYVEAHPHGCIEDLFAFTMVEKKKVLDDLAKSSISLKTLKEIWIKSTDTKCVGLFLTEPAFHILPSLPSKHCIAGFNKGRKFDTKKIMVGELSQDSYIVDSFGHPVKGF